MTSDPTMTNTATLLASLRRDVQVINAHLWDSAELIREVNATLAELERRAALPPLDADPSQPQLGGR